MHPSSLSEAPPRSELRGAPQEPHCLAGLPQHRGHHAQCPLPAVRSKGSFPGLKKPPASILLLGLGTSPKCPAPPHCQKASRAFKSSEPLGYCGVRLPVQNLVGTKPGGMLSLDPSWKEGWVFRQPPQHQSMD